ncbi:MAG TPA: type 1 glutamine amidotransferase [Rugosimonospora sp.]|nr:type 1 glutamine amidotransferase [Rugosimonospora sp.]
MRVLFVQQDHVSPPGPVGEGFARRGYGVELFPVVPEERFAAPGVDVRFPEPTDYDAIVPMGAPWSVLDPAIGGWVGRELAFLRKAHGAGVPVLGICFGGQAVAAALGGGVERAPVPEFGWHEVQTDAGDLVEPGPWFQFHHDRWVLPPGATEVARTPLASQAFRLGRTLAVQFHPELTVGMLRGWVDNGGGEHLRRYGVDPVALLARTEAEQDAARERAMRLVDRFLGLRGGTRTPGTPSR